MLNAPPEIKLVEETELNQIISKINNNAIKSILSFYYTMLEKEMATKIMETADGWQFRPLSIKPVVKMIGGDLAVGSEIQVGFISDFQATFMSEFVLYNSNNFRGETIFMGEIRRNIGDDPVPDDKLGTLKLQERKFFGHLKDVMEALWKRTCDSVARAGGNGSQKKQTAPAVESPPVEHNVEKPVGMMSSMPVPESPSVMKIGRSGIVKIPLEGLGDVVPQHRAEDDAEKVEVSTRSVIGMNAAPEPAVDDLDDDDDGDYGIPRRVPQIDDDLDEDDRLPRMDSSLMK